MLIAFTTTAQKAVKLTNTKTQKTITLKEGKRVIYSLKDSPEKKVGILNSITESTLMISDEEVPVSDIDAFGRNNKGNRFWAITEFIWGEELLSPPSKTLVMILVLVALKVNLLAEGTWPLRLELGLA